MNVSLQLRSFLDVFQWRATPMQRLPALKQPHSSNHAREETRHTPWDVKQPQGFSIRMASGGISFGGRGSEGQEVRQNHIRRSQAGKKSVIMTIKVTVGKNTSWALCLQFSLTIVFCLHLFHNKILLHIWKHDVGLKVMIQRTQAGGWSVNQKTFNQMIEFDLYVTLQSILSINGTNM